MVRKFVQELFLISFIIIRMKFRYFFLFMLAALLSFGNSVSGQIVGTDCFLQGNWVEVGINMMGGFGTCTSPATYHTHACCGGLTTFTPGVAMDMSYDPNHDGWGIGSPALMGPYSQPGYPQEGWAIQVGATEYRNGAWGATCTGEYDVPGTISAYSSVAGRMTSTWSGTIVGLRINQETRIDTQASWIVMTTYIYNTTAAPIADIYFERTLDPDNTSYWSGTPVTRNKIVHQNDDPTHRVMVSANGESAAVPGVAPAYDSVNSYLALATRDCRARCCVIAGLSPTTTPSSLWADIPLAFPPLGSGSVVLGGAKGQSNLQDEGISLIYNLGTIAAGDSAVISYAYIFDRDISIDSAFPDPTIVINGVEHTSDFPPLADYDTFLVCSVPGLITLPVSIRHGDDKSWTWGKWTWAPATGLSTTTGVAVNINIGALSGPTTYTITGTDSATGMTSCNRKMFYLTVYPCHSAYSNSPGTGFGSPTPTSANSICEGDTLRLFDKGDSTGATYLWFGPGPTITGASISSLQHPVIYPTTMADTGWYYSIKTQGGASDTVKTHVLIRLKPLITATYNPPVCSGNILLLYSNPDYVGETWSWTGPGGYTSTLSDPSINPAAVSDSGNYKVVVTLNGCTDSSTVHVVVTPTPPTPAVGSNSSICEGDTLKLTCGATLPGVTYSWAGPSGFTSTLQNPVIPTASVTASGTYSVTVRMGACTSTGSTVVLVKPIPVPVLGSNSPVCSGNSLNLTTSGPPGSTFAWVGPLSFTSTLQYPSINPAITANSGTYSVIVTLNGCSSPVTSITAVVDSTPEVPVLTTNSPGPPGLTICQDDTLMFTAVSGTAGASYYWSGPNSFTTTEQNPIIMHATPLASGVYTVVVSLGSCTSTATIITTVTPTPPITIGSNSPVCSGGADTIKLTAAGNPGSTYTWTGPYTFFSNAQNPLRTPVDTEYHGVYHATVLLDGCTNTATTTVVVNPTPTPPWVKWLTYCQFYDAPYLQAFGTNILWYTSSTPGTVGSTAPPKPTTDVVGIKFYFTNQTVSNCPSAIDSIRVTVNPSPTVTVSPDVTVCPWDSVLLAAVNTDPIAYFHWYPSMYVNDTSAASVIVRPETNMEYTVVSSNMYGCADTATVNVTVKANAVIHIPDSVLLFPGETYQIDPSTNCTWFSWSPSGGLSGKYLSNPVASPEISTKYVVTGVTEWGCKTKDSINVNINNESVITVPNAFAPGTGVNGVFRLIKRGQANLRYFRVYDRWGVVMFQTSNIDEGWDGTYKGTPQPVGVYIYDISAVSSTGKMFSKTGNVTLLR